MRLLRDVLRVYSYVFETALCAGGVLLTGFASASRNVTFNVPWLPWSGAHQLTWVFGVSLAGIVSVGLAAFGVTRIFLVLFSAATLAILLKGLFLNTQYAFSGAGDLRNAVLLVFGAFLAFIGSLFASLRRYR